MGRPRNDPASAVRVQLAPPPTLSDRMLALWHREFDRFAPGYYVPADVNGMLVYLHTVSEYDAAMARAAAAKKPSEARAERQEVRAIRKQLFTMQRALRMYPSTRGDPAKMANIANAPPAPPAAEGGEGGMPGVPWRQMMRDAGVTPLDDKRAG